MKRRNFIGMALAGLAGLLVPWKAKGQPKVKVMPLQTFHWYKEPVCPYPEPSIEAIGWKVGREKERRVLEAIMGG